MDNSISTPLTRLLNIKTPIFLAPMAGASGGALAAQVTNSGGFGFIGGGYMKVDQMTKELEIARSTLGPQFASPETPLPIGVGMLNWALEKDGGQNPFSDTLKLIHNQRVQVILFAFGANIENAVENIRELDKKRGGEKTLIFVQVNSLDDAKKAANEWKVDVIVAQGIEAGGHGSASALPLLTILPSVLAALPEGPPIIAAGGLTSGAHFASLLTLGASGIMVGTRFLACPESTYEEAKKQVILKSTGTQTVRSMAFDEVRGTTLWPKGVDGRGIDNAIVGDERQGLDIEERKKLFESSASQGKDDRLIVWAGTGVGSVTSVMTAADIVREIHTEGVKHIRAASSLIS